MLLLCLSMCLFVACSGKIDQITSDRGITLKGGGFEKGSRLLTEKIQLSEESVKKALELLPERFAALEESDMVAIDISVIKKGVKVQPDGKVRVSVPAPIKDVTDFVVFHVRSETEVEQLDCEFTPNSKQQIRASDRFRSE